MHAPDFWREDGVRAYLLAPLGIAYDAVSRISRGLVRTTKAEVPVVCVGNLVAGGAGKTPVAIALAERLIEHGAMPHFLTRGYGGKQMGPLKVDPVLHTPEDVGDEPLLLARVAPTWVARQRPAGAAQAAAAGADIVVMDDGHQNLTLYKDLALVVVDGAYGFGNGRVMPAGPLRERASSGLKRADAVVLIGDDETGAARHVRPSVPILNAELAPDEAQADKLAGQRVYAFAGIARPQKFFATLEAIGAEVVGTRAFPDHHPYEDSDLEDVLLSAQKLQATPVTTEKDAVRLPPARREQVSVLPVALAWDRPEVVDRLLGPLLSDD